MRREVRIEFPMYYHYSNHFPCFYRYKRIRLRARPLCLYVGAYRSAWLYGGKT